jgi:hypothetical protein
METHPYKSTTHQEKYYHFKDIFSNRFKAITIYARKDDNGIWYLAPAFCVKTDQFDRRVGRQVARRKFFLGNQLRIGSSLDYDTAKGAAYKLAYKLEQSN